MWICLSDSFLSIVAHRSKRDHLMVRARRAGDIEKIFPGYEEEYTPNADYLYRAIIPRSVVIEYMVNEIHSINYDNFKNSVRDNQLHNAYADFWSVMYNLQHNLKNRFKSRV